MLWRQPYGTKNIDVEKFLYGYKLDKLASSTFISPRIMSTSALPRLFSLCCLLALTACGANTETSAPATALAATATHTPVADCEPQACQGLRIIDSNAETFRADSMRRDALALAVARMDNGNPSAQ
jgi:hypothetical protein